MDRTDILVDALGILFPDEPFFDGATQGKQGVKARHDILSLLVETSKMRKVDILEVGSWTGLSALTWGGAIHGHCPDYGSITCVDRWRPYVSQPDLAKGHIYTKMNDMLSTGLAYALFLHNTKFMAPHVGFSHRVGTLSEVRDSLGQYDLIYLDGSHYYADVLRDLKESHSLLRDGGILCGDDLELQLHEADEALTRQNTERDFIFDLDGRAFHPGVTLAVGERLGEVWEMGGVWAARKNGDTYDKFDFK